MRLIAAEGTVEELVEFQARTGLFDEAGLQALAPTDSEGEDAEPDHPQRLAWQEFVDKHAEGSQYQEHIVEFVRTCTGRWPEEVEVRLGQNKSVWLRLHRRGVSRGGDVYVNTSSARSNHRVPAERADSYQHAYRRDAKGDWKVSVNLTSPEAVEDAVELAREALQLDD